MKEKELFNICLIEGEYEAVQGELTTEDMCNGISHEFYCDEDYVWYSIVMCPNGEYDKEDRLFKRIEDISSYDREKLFELLNENHYKYTDNLEYLDEYTKGCFDVIVRMHGIDWFEDVDGEDLPFVHEKDKIVERFKYHTEWNETFECWNVVIEK